MNGKSSLFYELDFLFDSCVEGIAAPVDRESFRQWMKSDDIECLSVLYDFVLEPTCLKYVHPELTHREVFAFLLGFWNRCLLENREFPMDFESHCRTRYGVGGEIASYLKASAKEEDPYGDIPHIVAMFAELYTSGDKDMRLCIETATLEHVLRIPPIRKAFRHWRADPVLNEALVNGLGGPRP